MRWDGLFEDLEAQADALELAERAAAVDERARHEFGRIRLVDRLRPAVGTVLRVHCEGDVRVSGVLRRTAADWLLIDEGSGREAFVLLAALLTVAGLGRSAAVPDSETVVESRLGARQALRGIARDRSPVRLHLVDGGVLDGTVDRVGADLLELALHAPGEMRRRAEVRAVEVVSFRAISCLRRDS